VVLVLDQAGWHHATDLRIPDRIDLLFLPTYSPELQPAERLWPISPTSMTRWLPAANSCAPTAQPCRTTPGFIDGPPSLLHSTTDYPEFVLVSQK
jgi:hypothetical protein